MPFTASGLLSALAGGISRLRRRMHSGRSRAALVLRLENPDVLRLSLGPTIMTQLVATIARELSHALNTRHPIQTGGRGEFRVMLGRMSARDLLRCSDIIRSLGKKGVTVSGQRLLPALAGVVIRDLTGDTAEDALFDFGSRVLARSGPGAGGHIAVLGYEPAQVELHLAQAPLFSLDWLELRFHPRLCADTGIIRAAEVEPILHHPDFGRIEPQSFIHRLTPDELAELTRATVCMAVESLRDWDSAGAGVESLTLRLGDDQIDHPDLADIILWELDRQDLPPARIAVTFPRGADQIAANGHARHNTERLAAAGCQLELDEFGLGNARVDDLRKYRVKAVRISPAFTDQCDHQTEQQRMILAILALAEHFGLRTVAQDVRTAAERSFLTQIGVDHLHGDAISLPLGQREMTRFLAETHRPAPVSLPMRHAG